MFSEVNERDARAAMKVWILTVAQQRKIPIDPEPNFGLTIDALIRLGKDDRISGFGIVLPEFPRLSREFEFDHIALAVVQGQVAEEYVLLVNRDSGVENLGQLKGGSLGLLETPRTSLAMIWLDTVLLQSGLGQAADFFGRIDTKPNAARVALPVFFKQADAALVTRSSFEVMLELNPQLKEKLHILAACPPVIPSGFVFRSDLPTLRDNLISDAMARLADSPAGRQILTLIKADKVESQPIACLGPTLEMLANHARLVEQATRPTEHKF